MKADPINARLWLLFLTFPQSIAVLLATVAAWLPATVPWETFFAGKPLSAFTRQLLEFDNLIAPASDDCWIVALAVSGTHFFIAFALLWSSREPRIFQFRWIVFSAGLWIFLLVAAVCFLLFLVIPLLPVLQNMTIPGSSAAPGSLFGQERIVDTAVAIGFILLAVAAVGIYQRDRKLGLAEATALP